MEPDDAVPVAELAQVLGQGSDPRRRVERVALGGLSALRWGEGEPQVVLLHGGGQNAHTWDAVNVVLDVPSLAVDLPGHGHSAWRHDRDYSPWASAETLAEVLPVLAPQAQAVVGMSLGGLTSIRLRAIRPALVPRLLLVDVTPGVAARVGAMPLRERGTAALVEGPVTFESRDDMVAAVAALAPGRDPEALRRGVAYNSRRDASGGWRWRYDALDRVGRERYDDLWGDLAEGHAPVGLAVAARAGMVTPADEERFLRVRPGSPVTRFDTADHSIQSARPVELAELVRACLSWRA